MWMRVDILLLLQVVHGTTDRWYDEMAEEAPYESIASAAGRVQLNTTDCDNCFWAIQLPFRFPWFDRFVTSIAVPILSLNF